jgi:hypothetical protein
VEMYLLSHAMDGCLSFLVVDVETQRCREPLRRYCAVNLEEDERRPEILRYRKEIALHYCVYSGKQGDAPNHYDCIDYKFSDERIETQWEIALETARQRRAREDLLLRVAKAAVNNNRADAAGKELTDYHAAEELAAEQSRTPHNSPPRTGRAKTNRRTPQQPEHNVLSPRAHLSRTRATPNQQQGPASPTRGNAANRNRNNCQSLSGNGQPLNGPQRYPTPQEQQYRRSRPGRKSMSQRCEIFPVSSLVCISRL